MKLKYVSILFIMVCVFCVSGCAINPYDDIAESPYDQVAASPYLHPQYIEAQELKLKVRELADQLLSTLPNSYLAGYVAFPTSFVNINNVQESSPFGRIMGESLIYEFNQRGFLVREYKLSGYMAIKAQQGDFVLNRNGMIMADEKWTALIIGTYHEADNSIFVNARLVRSTDGMVLRTAQLVLANNSYTTNLFYKAPKIALGTLNIEQAKN